MRSLFDLVHEAASRDLGLIARARLVERFGLPERTIGDWTRVGRLQTMCPGIYLVMGAPVTWETHVLAVCMSHGGGVAPHRRCDPRCASSRPHRARDREATRRARCAGATGSPNPALRRPRHPAHQPRPHGRARPARAPTRQPRASAAPPRTVRGRGRAPGAVRAGDVARARSARRDRLRPTDPGCSPPPCARRRVHG